MNRNFKIYLLIFIAIILFSCKKGGLELTQIVERIAMDVEKLNIPAQKKEKEKQQGKVGNIDEPKNEPSTIELIVDVTESMKGFVKVNPNSLNNFLQNMTFTLSSDRIKYYSFFEELKIEDDGFRVFDDPDIFKSISTNYTSIPEMISSDNVTIIISDLQFNSREDFLGLIPHFQNFLGENKFIRIFGAEFLFDGIVYQDLPPYNKNIYHRGDRPIYAVIIGDVRFYDYISNLFVRFPKWSHSLTLINNYKSESYKISGVDIPNSMLLWDYNKSIYFSEYLKVKNPNQCVLKIQLENYLLNEWEGFDKENINWEVYDFKKPENKFVLDTSMEYELIIDQLEINDGDKLDFQLIIPPINIENAKLIRFFLRPNVVPEWISQWSCELNDGMDVIKNHTVWLENFISRVTMRLDQPVTYTSFYLLFVH